MGQEKAEEMVVMAARQAGLAGEAYTFDEAMRVLEVLAHVGGLVGTVARFAKARAVFLFDG